MVSTRPLISKSSSPCTNPLVTVLRAPITIGIAVTFMFHSFFDSLARSRYLLFFLLSFKFTLWSSKAARSTIKHVLFFFSLLQSLVVWPRLGDPFVSQNPGKCCAYYYYYSPGESFSPTIADKSFQISWALLSIQAYFSSIIFCVVLISPLICNTSLFQGLWGPFRRQQLQRLLLSPSCSTAFSAFRQDFSICLSVCVLLFSLYVPKQRKSSFLLFN